VAKNVEQQIAKHEESASDQEFWSATLYLDPDPKDKAYDPVVMIVLFGSFLHYLCTRSFALQLGNLKTPSAFPHSTRRILTPSKILSLHFHPQVLFSVKCNWARGCSTRER
jgi:hypothetical protein